MTHLCVILSLFAFCLTDYDGMFTLCLVLTNFLMFDYLSKGFILYGCFSIKFCSISWCKKKTKKQGSRFCYGMFTLCLDLTNFLTPVWLRSKPSLNTQSCIKGLLVVRDFCFWAVWAAGPVLKKKFWADYEQLLRAFFHVFRGKKNVIFFLNIVESALKSCIKWSLKKWKKNLKKLIMNFK